MFPTYLSTVFILGCYEYVNRLGSHDVHIHFMYERSLYKSNWPVDVSIRAETCRRWYLNEMYVLVVFDGVYYSLDNKRQRDGSSQNYYHPVGSSH
jgi:hypothetical protein